MNEKRLNPRALTIMLAIVLLALFAAWRLSPLTAEGTNPFGSPLPPRPTPDLDPPDWEGLWRCYGECDQTYSHLEEQELCYAWCSSCGEFWENIYGPGIYDELMDYEACLELLRPQEDISVLYLPLVCGRK